MGKDSLSHSYPPQRPVLYFYLRLILFRQFMLFGRLHTLYPAFLTSFIEEAPRDVQSILEYCASGCNDKELTDRMKTLYKALVLTLAQSKNSKMQKSIRECIPFDSLGGPNIQDIGCNPRLLVFIMCWCAYIKIEVGDKDDGLNTFARLVSVRYNGGVANREKWFFDGDDLNTFLSRLNGRLLNMMSFGGCFFQSNVGCEIVDEVQDDLMMLLGTKFDFFRHSESGKRFCVAVVLILSRILILHIQIQFTEAVKDKKDGAKKEKEGAKKEEEEVKQQKAEAKQAGSEY